MAVKVCENCGEEYSSEDAGLNENSLTWARRKCCGRKCQLEQSKKKGWNVRRAGQTRENHPKRGRDPR